MSMSTVVLKLSSKILSSPCSLTSLALAGMAGRSSTSWKSNCNPFHKFKSFNYYSGYSSRMTEPDLQSLDAEQRRLLEEECILVDSFDKVIGSASKKNCHLLKNIKDGMLHRAFSVFLFNDKNELLLQQRSDAKITFPNHFTNSCCSHPLYFEAEIDEAKNIGIKRAAQRRLKYELGIIPEQIPLDDINFLTKIHYKAENVPKDDIWGEHEVDYILFIKKNVDLNVNENEIKSIKYVSLQDMPGFLADTEKQRIPITPWFRLITDTFLYKWWKDINNISKHMDDKVHHL